MSTRGMIARQNPDGTVTAIYSHSNNYVEANGWLPATHYADSALVDQLLALEAICEVGLTIGERHPYRDQERVMPGGWLTQCLSFYRDRGETHCMAQTIPVAIWPELAAEGDAEMVFLWEGQRWLCATCQGSGRHARFGPWKQLIRHADGTVTAERA